MKKLFSLILAILMINVLGATVLKQQGFEGSASDTWGYTANPEADTYNAYTIWDRDNNFGASGLPDNMTPLPDGDYVWNAENTENIPESNGLACSLIFDTVDLNSYNGDLSVVFNYYTFFYGEISTWKGEGDVINYYVEYDSGTNWNTPIALNMGTNEWTEVTIDIPESSTHVRLKFEVLNDDGNEIAAFDFITLETTDAATPITLSDFAAEALSSGINVNWITASEKENSGFKLLRDGEIIAFLEGAGTSTESHNYSFLDKNVIPGNSYVYTLADVAYDNSVTLHENEITVTALSGSVNSPVFEMSSAYPNPFNPSTSIDYDLTETQDVELSIFNMKGEKEATLFSGERTAGHYSQTWNAANVESGVYLLRAKFGNEITTQKLLLIK